MAEIGLITIRELLRDPHYKAYFTKVPKLPDHYTPEALPWRLLVMKQGEHVWRGKRYGTYQEAFAGLKKMMPTITNAAINCPPLGFMPPIRNVRVKNKIDQRTKQPMIKSLVWKPTLEMDMAKHEWCAHCRRPSIFVDRGLGARMLNGYRMAATRTAYRCCICGSSAEIMDIRRPELNQNWDLNRPKLHNVA